MPGTSPTTEQVLLALAATSVRIADLTARATAAQCQAGPADGEWSANEVLAHLRVCADVWGNAIEAIESEDRPTLRAVNPRTWVTKTDYVELGFRGSLRAFTEQRAALLGIPESLRPEGWSRSATLVGGGSPLQRTVRHYAEHLVRHVRPHVKQIKRIFEG